VSGPSAFLDAHCLDLEAALVAGAALPAERRLAHLLAAAGCGFHDGDRRRLVSGPSARLTALGGLPFSTLARLGLDPRAAAEATRGSMGALGAMSYLSVPGGSSGAAYEAVAVGHGHVSVAHGASVSVLVAGISCACANEFNVQRDLVHLARVTEARTAAQSAPPIVVPHPRLARSHARLLAACDAIRAEAASDLAGALDGRDAAEALNLAFPAGKATALVVTGTLRNVQKLLAAETDPGKEREFRSALAALREPLGALWPDLFPAPVTESSHEPETVGPGRR
jgi:hypothetical protein